MNKLIFRFKTAIPPRLIEYLRPPYHFLLAFFAAIFYGFPSRRIKVIGITGTKGKTTVIELVHKILEEAGFRVASVSSLRFKINGEETRNEFKMTMPGRFFLQKFLHEAAKKGCQYAVVEVTSEGIKQFRHRFIDFKSAILTNVSPEHIESHGSFEKYLRAKLDLFWRLSKDATAIINCDDPNFKRFWAATAARRIFYGKGGVELADKKISVRHIAVKESGSEFEINGTKISSSLPGEFNFYNVLAAAAFGLSEHISPEKIVWAIEKVRDIPGRMEFIRHEPFAVIVDYAHTPDSLRSVYETLRKFKKFKSLICVLGAAGGGRDKWKRPEFGKIAAEFCDEIILTNEDPYDENPATILDEIEAGFSQILDSRFQILNPRKILDRREAIREALKLAKAGDVVVITGKGAEPWIMGPNETKMPWDDREIIKEELKNIK